MIVEVKDTRKEDEEIKKETHNINHKYSLDVLYGVDIMTYCQAHGITHEELLNSTMIDIDMLRKNYLKYANKDKLNDEELKIVSSIEALLNKKKNHYQRLIDLLKKSSCF